MQNLWTNNPLVLYNVDMEKGQEPVLNPDEKPKESQSKDYNSKWSAKFYKFFSLLSFLVYYVNCTVRIFTRAAEYYRSKGVNSFIGWLKAASDTSLWGETLKAIFDWYTVTLLVFLLVYAIVFFIIFARFSPRSKKTFKYFKKSFSLARKFLKVINIALTLVVLINTARMTSDDSARAGDKFTFIISVFSLLFALIQIALSIATWVITSKIKKRYKDYKQKVSGVGYVVSRYISPSVRRGRRLQTTAQTSNDSQEPIEDNSQQVKVEENGPSLQETQITQIGDNEVMEKKNKPKTTIAQKLGKIKSRFLRTLAALSLTDKEADEAMKEKEEEYNSSNDNSSDDTERFESDYAKNHQEEECAADDANVIEPDEDSISISVDEEYVERYKRQKAEKRKENVEDIKKKLGDFGDRVDEAGNKITDNIKKAYRKVKSKIKPDKKKDDASKENNDDSVSKNQDGSDADQQ